MSEVGILHGEDPPGLWEHRSVGGGYITYDLPRGVSVDGMEPDDDEKVELVLDLDGDHTDDNENRFVEVWIVSYTAEHILMNYKDYAEVIIETVGLSDAAEQATKWMREHPGNE